MPFFSSLTSYFSSSPIFSFSSKKGTSNSLKTTDVQNLISWIRENINDKKAAEEMYLDLIKENPFCIAHLKPDELNQRLCSTAFAIDQSVKDFIPNNFFTLEMHHTLYLNDVNYFKNLPDYMKSKDLCLIAVKDSSDNLKYVPENMRTREILKAAFNNFKHKTNN